MNCLFSMVFTDQPTAAGVLYRCEVCAHVYRTRTSIDRVARECVGTAEQWAAKRREIAVACVSEAVPAASIPRALEQLDRCLACRAFAGTQCRMLGCTKHWLRVLKSERCEAR